MVKITCPNCGAEYALQEIFIMSNFNNTNIVKDESGKILSSLEYDNEESYKCDFCDKTFFANMNIEANTFVSKVEPHTTKLHKPALFFKED